MNCPKSIPLLPKGDDPRVVSLDNMMDEVKSSIIRVIFLMLDTPSYSSSLRKSLDMTNYVQECQAAGQFWILIDKIHCYEQHDLDVLQHSRNQPTVNAVALFNVTKPEKIKLPT